MCLFTRVQGSLFLIANTIMLDRPIIYCSAQFSTKMKFSRAAVLRKNAYLDFLFGKQTNLPSIECYREAINLNKKQNVEMILYDKSGFEAWYLVSTVPAVNIKLEITLILVFFNETGHLKTLLSDLDSPKTKWRKIGKHVIIKNELKSFVEKRTDDKKMSLNEMISFYKDLLIPFYGREKVQLPLFVINHNHILKRTWDLSILFIMVYTALELPFSICFKVYPQVIYILDHIFDSAYLVDIGLNFITTYLDKNGLLVRDLKTIAMNYLKGWFSVHVFFGLLTFISLFFHIHGDDSLYAFRILLLIRLLRIPTAIKKLIPYLDNKIFTLFVWMFFFFTCAHWLACIWYLIGYQFDLVEKPNNDGWLSDLSMIIAECDNCGNVTTINADRKGPPLKESYVTALYFAITMMSTCGFGNRGNTADTLTEKYFAIFAMIISCVLYAFIFAKVNNIIAQLCQATNEYSTQLNAIRLFIKTYKIPNIIGSRLEDYFIATWTVTRGADQEKIMNIYPRDLQSDLCLSIHKKVLEKQPCFKKMSKKALRSISRYFWVLRTPPGDMLVNNSELLSSIYFVVSGTFEVNCEDELIGLMGPGDLFGKRLDAKPYISTCDVKATSYGIVHSINVDSLFEALELYPEDLNKIIYSLKLSIDITNKRRNRGKLKESLLNNWGKRMISVHDLNSLSFEASNLTQMDYSDYHTKPRSTLSKHNQDVAIELHRKGSIKTSDKNAKFVALETRLKNTRKIIKKTSNKVDPELGNQLSELELGNQLIELNCSSTDKNLFTNTFV